MKVDSFNETRQVTRTVVDIVTTVNVSITLTQREAELLCLVIGGMHPDIAAKSVNNSLSDIYIGRTVNETSASEMGEFDCAIYNSIQAELRKID